MVPSHALLLKYRSLNFKYMCYKGRKIFQFNEKYKIKGGDKERNWSDQKHSTGHKTGKQNGFLLPPWISPSSILGIISVKEKKPIVSYINYHLKKNNGCIIPLRRNTRIILPLFIHKFIKIIIIIKLIVACLVLRQYVRLQMGVLS